MYVPVFKQGEGQAPAWSELEMFEIIDLVKGEEKEIAFRGPKERYIVCEGEVEGTVNGEASIYKRGEIMDVPKDAKVVLRSDSGKIVRLCGSWGDEIGGLGLFPVFPAEEPTNGIMGISGTPAYYDFARNASFDNHYHDCDEYWIVFQGSGIAASEGKLYYVEPGDCIATGYGNHHDFPFVKEPILAVFFETTMVGQKRPGHLWEHQHGPA